MSTMFNFPSSTEKFLEQMTMINPRFSVSSYFAQFSKLKTNMDRVKFVYKDLKKYKIFPKFSKFGKDDTLARKHREDGNELFKRGCYELAYIKYNDGLKAAKSTKELSLMYANRSACLFKIGRFEECVVDINRAFENNYSGNLRTSLHERRQNAQEIMRFLKKQPYHAEIPKIPADKKHPHIQSAKHGISIETNEKFGRHIVATRDISVGELLCVEESFTIFLTTTIRIHCHYCVQLCYNPIPCKNCGFLLFCSKACQDTAFDLYHKYECPILGTMIENGLDYSDIFALRVAIQARPHYEDLTLLDGVEEGVYRSDRYKEIHNLDTELEKRPVEKLFQFAVAAAYMHYFLLKKTTFFNGITNEEAFADVIFQQLLTVSIHRLPIQEDVPPDNRSIIGWGLYSFSSLFKHSCCPNVENIQYGSTMVLRSLGTIKKGEQCFISYGVLSKDDIGIRQQYLREFSLSCECQACRNDQYCFTYIHRFERGLFDDLDVTEAEFLRVMFQLFSKKLDVVERLLPMMKKYVKKLEKKESAGNLLRLQSILGACYRMFGNKRDL